ncbi:DUF4843 domain-containing protein [Sphingobacterium sp. WQ 366]|uniref:DUF4843 domain-containing protein n=2 Tax=Sphingobacterium bovistauri TaxID=2781959 RepID=A0ABS7Z9S6_9SPHI|nr:DUF4843 domain-containing protein [Sphingobacterium bovistauri]
MKNSIILTLIIFLFNSCEKNQNIEVYDQNESYIHFAVPNTGTTSQRQGELFVDSLNFSFVFEDVNLENKRMAIPINIIGVAKSSDRSYQVEIDEKNSNIDLTSIDLETPVIKANHTVDSLFVNIKKTDKLREGTFYLYLNLKDNENFKLGHSKNTRMKISITNRLSQPIWWTRWINFFGPYNQEVYQKWIQIYYLGADPSPDIYGKFPAPYYYWDNMPPSASASSYPVTFMYIRKLKEYFMENAVYPNGDLSKPRIYLP